MATAKTASEKGLPTSAVLVTLRLLANLLSHPEMADHLLSDCQIPSFDGTAVHVTPWNLVVTAVLSHFLEDASHYCQTYMQDKSVRQTLFSVVYNLAVHASRQRRLARGLSPTTSTPTTPSPSTGTTKHPLPLPSSDQEPDYVIEIASALLHNLHVTTTQEPDEETAYRLLVALLYLLYLCHEVLMELTHVMDAEQAIRHFEKRGETEKRLGVVCTDLLTLLRAPSRS